MSAAVVASSHDPTEEEWACIARTTGRCVPNQLDGWPYRRGRQWSRLPFPGDCYSSPHEATRRRASGRVTSGGKPRPLLMRNVMRIRQVVLAVLLSSIPLHAQAPAAGPGGAPAAPPFTLT